MSDIFDKEAAIHEDPLDNFSVTSALMSKEMVIANDESLNILKS
jgi:hypothetical protein